MKRLAIFCDGTWNKPDNKFETHVERLGPNISAEDKDGNQQKAHYFSGVGSGKGDNVISQFIDRFAGGAFGYGLDDRILRAYSWLAHEYRPGDAIYIFGFSRGAYTARSLGGMIRASGLPNEANLHRIPEAFARYRDRDDRTRPGSPESSAFRLGYAPEVYTGHEEKAWREERGHTVGTQLSIAYLGIWDTVGSLGVPGVFGRIAKPFNAKHLFHDTVLSSSVKAGRHAIATDERRRLYEPTAWSNVAKLNGEEPARPYRQQWFAGDHGMIGGSGENRQLSEYTMDWIVEGAVAAGLAVNEDFLTTTRGGRNFGGPLSNHRKRWFGRARKATIHTPDIGTACLHRLKFGDLDGNHYDPETLRDLKRDLPTERHPDWP